jgi:hypothetical protein
VLPVASTDPTVASTDTTVASTDTTAPQVIIIVVAVSLLCILVALGIRKFMFSSPAQQQNAKPATTL